MMCDGEELSKDVINTACSIFNSILFLIYVNNIRAFISTDATLKQIIIIHKALNSSESAEQHLPDWFHPNCLN